MIVQSDIWAFDHNYANGQVSVHQSDTHIWIQEIAL